VGIAKFIVCEKRPKYTGIFWGVETNLSTYIGTTDIDGTAQPTARILDMGWLVEAKIWCQNNQWLLRNP